jgi:hypothetical protein
VVARHWQGTNHMNNNSDLIIYQTPSGDIKLDVRLESETVWLTQAHMAELFGKSKKTISEHIQNIFIEGELDQDVVIRKFRTTSQHGAIEGKTQSNEVQFYNLDVIISVGYRVKSPQGTQFRIWATQRLKEYIIKGFAFNSERFKTGNSINKPLGDAFSNPDLQGYLARKKVGTLFIAGSAGEACVLMTVWGATNRGYQVYVIDDATYFIFPDKKKQTIYKKYSELGAKVISLKELPSVLQNQKTVDMAP